MADTRAKQHQRYRPLFIGDGFTVGQWTGNKDDYMDTYHEDGGIKRSEISWVPLLVSGGWEVIRLEGGFTFNLTKDNPFGTEQDRPAGTYRGYCTEDNTVRLCIFPTDDEGERTFATFDSKIFLGDGGKITVPQKGLFVLSGGDLEVRGQKFSAVHLFRAVSGDIELDIPKGVYGAAVWGVSNA